MISKSHIFILILFFTLTIKAMDTEVCSAYLLKSQQLDCSSDNYLTQFGYNYCVAYLSKTLDFSVKGQFILNNIRLCLINKLFQESSLTCKNVKTKAQRMHIDCYSENHFCDLNIIDKNKVFWIAKKEVLDPVFLRTLLSVIKSCN